MEDVQEVRRLREALVTLQSCVDRVAERWGDALPVRRLCDDARRVGEDLLHLGPPPPLRPAAPMEVLPDGDYEASFWAGADEEGLGQART